LAVGLIKFKVRYAHLVDLANMGRFAPFYPSWNQAFHDRVQRKAGRPMHGRFADCNATLDGDRLPVCATVRDGDLLCNPYVNIIVLFFFMCLIRFDIKIPHFQTLIVLNSPNDIEFSRWLMYLLNSFGKFEPLFYGIIGRLGRLFVTEPIKKQAFSGMVSFFSVSAWPLTLFSAFGPF
jgi:hypothetical protein